MLVLGYSEDFREPGLKTSITTANIIPEINFIASANLPFSTVKNSFLHLHDALPKDQCEISGRMLPQRKKESKTQRYNQKNLMKMIEGSSSSPSIPFKIIWKWPEQSAK